MVDAGGLNFSSRTKKSSSQFQGFGMRGYIPMMRATAGRRCMLRSIHSGILNNKSAVWFVGSALVAPAIESVLGGNISSGLTRTIDHCCQLIHFKTTYVDGRNNDFDRHGKQKEYPFDAFQTYYQRFPEDGTYF